MLFDYLQIALFFAVWTLAGTLILTAAYIAAKFYEKDAASRHSIRFTAFCAILLFPLFALVVPSRKSADIRVPISVSNVAVQGSSVSAIASKPVFVKPVSVEASMASVVPETSEKPSPVATRTPSFDSMNILSRCAVALVIAWLLGSLIFAVQGVIAFAKLRLLCDRSKPIREGSIDVQTLASRVGINQIRSVRVCTTEHPIAGMTWGVLKHTVLLPQASERWAAKRTEAVVLHELAHIRRMDCLCQLVAYFVCVLHWFNPIVWISARAMRSDAEIAADDCVLMAGVKPSAYAAELLRIFVQVGKSSQTQFDLGVSIMKQSKIETRLRSLVDTTVQRRRITPRDLFKMAFVWTLCLLTIAALRPNVIAADSSKIQPRPPVSADTAQLDIQITEVANSIPKSDPAQGAQLRKQIQILRQKTRELVKQQKPMMEADAIKAARLQILTQRDKDLLRVQAEVDQSNLSPKLRNMIKASADKAIKSGVDAGLKGLSIPIKTTCRPKIKITISPDDVDKVDADDAHQDSMDARSDAIDAQIEKKNAAIEEKNTQIDADNAQKLDEQITLSVSKAVDESVDCRNIQINIDKRTQRLIESHLDKKALEAQAKHAADSTAAAMDAASAAMQKVLDRAGDTLSDGN